MLSEELSASRAPIGNQAGGAGVSRDVRRLLLLLTLPIGLAACGAAPEPGPGPAAAGGQPGLPVGRAFVATAASEDGRERRLVAKAGIEFLADGRISVATGCNRGSGQARLRGGRLVTDGLAVTEMGCADPGVSEQEAFVLSVVEGEPEVSVEGDVLVLRTASAEIRFRDEKVVDPDRSLEGTRWQVTGTFDSQLASSLAAPQGHLVLANGRVRYTGPCHDIEGPATIAGTTVTFGPLTTGPARPCTPDQQRAEATVIALLSGPLRATVRATTLRLDRSDGSGITLVEAR